MIRADHPGADGPLVVGVDGCPGGWVAVVADRETILDAEVVTDLAPLIGDTRGGRFAALAIDMPIGLLADRPRRADIEARALLGSRRSTVFPAPVRSVLAATSYAEACDLSRAASGKALSKQTYNLVDRIRGLDEILEPEDGLRIVEAHPELAFARLAGEPLPPKKRHEGRARRIEVLDDALGARFGALLARRPAPLTDLLDAAVLTVTARRVVDGSEVRLGTEVDDTGKSIQVVY